MSKKRKRTVKQPDPVPVDAWKAWLADPEDTAPLAQPEQAIATLQFLSGERDAPPEPTGSLAQALVDLLAEGGRHEALIACAERGGAELSKLARKAVFSLRRQGADLPEPRPREETLPYGGAPGATAHDADRRAAMSCPAHDGQVLLFLRLRGATDRRLYAAVAIVNDTRGLVKMTSYVAKSGLYGILVRGARERTAIGEVPFDYALARLHAAAAKARSQGRILPEGWVGLRPQLPPPPEPAPPHPAESLPVGTLPDPAAQWRLFEDPVLKPLLPDLDALEALGKRIQETLQSEILVDDSQRAQQVTAAVEEALRAAFDAAGRETWQRRLCDAAWIAAEERRPELAGILMALRATLAAGSDPGDIPFFRQLFVRAFVDRVPAALLEAAAPGLPQASGQESQSGSGSRLWTPGQGDEASDGLWTPDEDATDSPDDPDGPRVVSG